MELNKQNHDKGFLVGEEWLGGVHAGVSECYVAFVISHRSGEYVLNQEFRDLDSALGAINCLGVDWRFEKASGGCGSGKCGGGKCGNGACGSGDRASATK